jgi:hypothetical protein
MIYILLLIMTFFYILLYNAIITPSTIKAIIKGIYAPYPDGGGGGAANSV